MEPVVHARVPMARIRRRIIVLALAGVATAPALLTAAVLFGCCVLPFHREIHRVVPLCHIAAKVLPDKAPRESPSPAPPPRDEPQKRFAATATARVALYAAVRVLEVEITAIPSAHRSLITLGAVRCDEDVGLRLMLLATLLI
jgi:hypothetical protein